MTLYPEDILLPILILGILWIVYMLFFMPRGSRVKEELEAIDKILNNDLERIRRLESEITALKRDIAILKGDIVPTISGDYYPKQAQAMADMFKKPYKKSTKVNKLRK